MPWKSIAIFVGEGPFRGAALRYAARLAERNDAHLIGLHLVPSIYSRRPADGFARGHEAMARVIERHKSEEREAREVALEAFNTAVAAEGISGEFRIIGQNGSHKEAILNALHADLVVVSASAIGALPSGMSAEMLLLETGVPVLLVPDDWNVNRIGDNVTVGWNASQQARRAVIDALPLLQDAVSVVVAVVDSEGNGRHGANPGSDIGLYLSRHGVSVTVQNVASDGQTVASTLVRHAQDRKSDLIVIGAYSHSRTGELLFGGTTHFLTRHVSIPTFIAH